MKSINYISIILILAAIGVTSCTSPTDVEANRYKKIDDGTNLAEDILSVSPQYIDFGSVYPNESKTMKLTISNLQAIPYTIFKVSSMRFKDAFLFRKNQVPVTINPAGYDKSSIDLDLTFHALYPGEIRDTLMINDLTTPKVIVKAQVPVFYATEAEFDDVPRNEKSYRSVTIKNLSSHTALISGFVIHDPLNVFKIETRNFPITLGPDQFEQFVISFMPKGKGSYSASVEFIVETEATGIIDNISYLSATVE